MRLLAHRGQAVLLLIVGGLAVAAVASAVLEWTGVPVLATLRVSDLFAPPPSRIPAQIVIGRPAIPSNDGGLVQGQAGTAPAAPAVAEPTPRPSARPVTGATVVPATVYSYPPDEHGGGGGGSGHGSGGGHDSRGG